MSPGKPVITLPFGSQEEQGRHAPMGDFMLMEAIALKVAEASGTIVAQRMPVTVPLDCHEVNDDGVLSGDPQLATAQKSERIFYHLVGFCSRFVDHIHAFNMRSPSHQTQKAI
ncbi:creatininase family protein [Agrobacterium larrymoorei]|uniref:Creatininase family protein n=1 Tax=Agrobacterium larrymoorei TaxID=160699 RepID=A0AAF0HDV3_9HYPH|nr:creatininase family protein [Agrobacterium larrymoorei]WHA44087.1 creatininase family protein [Agrobacterium larrymoorei]